MIRQKNKTIALISAALLCGMGMISCESNYYNLPGVNSDVTDMGIYNNKSVEFTVECTKSGGKMNSPQSDLSTPTEDEDSSEVPRMNYRCICNEVECDEGIVCTNDGLRCANNPIVANSLCSPDSDPDVCSEDNQSVLKCDSSGVYQSVSCDNGCRDGECITCADGEIKCEDSDTNEAASIYRCIDGQFIFDHSCQAVSCISKTDCGKCRNGTSVCHNDASGIGQIETCSNGEYLDKTLCTDSDDKAVSCTLDGLSCGKCLNGTNKCEDRADGSYQSTCINGVFEEKKCQENTGCDGDVCLSCEDDMTTCSNSGAVGFIRRCVGNVYGNAEICPDNASCNGRKCGKCTNGDTKCSNTNEIGQLQTCVNGAFPEAVICPDNASCADEKNCGECKNGVTSCENNTESGIGQRTSCENGAYHTIPCEGDFSCNEEKTQCGDCRNGETRCSNDVNGIGQFQTCVNGKFEIAVACSNNASCTENNICGECNNNVTICENNEESGIGQVTSCEDGKPSTKSCEDGLSCDKAGIMCGHCQDGQTLCHNDENGIGLLSTCEDGEFENAACLNNASCTGDVCGECNNNAKICENKPETGIGYLTTCDNGKLTENECGNGVSCDGAGTECGVCHDGDTLCLDDENGIGQLSTCEDGAYAEAVPCDNGVSCHDNQCGSCLNSITECRTDESSIGHYKTCSNGVYSEETNCAYDYPCNNAGTDCVECIYGEYNPNCGSDRVLAFCIDGYFKSYRCSELTGINSASCETVNYSSYCRSSSIQQIQQNKRCYQDDSANRAYIYNIENSIGNHTLSFSYFCSTGKCNAEHTDCQY